LPILLGVFSQSGTHLGINSAWFSNWLVRAADSFTLNTRTAGATSQASGHGAIARTTRSYSTCSPVRNWSVTSDFLTYFIFVIRGCGCSTRSCVGDGPMPHDYYASLPILMPGGQHHRSAEQSSFRISPFAAPYAVVEHAHPEDPL
jgi:hypothetical protein